MERSDKSLIERAVLGCADVEELLDSYLDDEIEVGLARRFEAHLCRCSDCQELVQDSRSILSTARSLAERSIPDDVSRRLRQALFEQVGHRAPARPRLTVVKT